MRQQENERGESSTMSEQRDVRIKAAKSSFQTIRDQLAAINATVSVFNLGEPEPSDAYKKTLAAMTIIAGNLNYIRGSF
jgi:hypothetical protein